MNKRFLALDSFRGLFALSVVMFHMHLVGSITEIDFFRGSSLFVEFFFILSGFVITHGFAYKEDLKFSSFAISRAFRLFPLHIFMLIVFLGIELGKLAAFKYAGFTFSSDPFTDSSAISQILPNLFLIQSWFPFTDHESFNYPSWSISIEYYIYLIFFIITMVFKQFKVLAWAFISLIMIWLLANESTYLEKEVMRGLSCFFLGSLTYVTYNHFKHIKANFYTSSTLELICLIIVITVVSSDIEFKSLISSLIFCITVFIFSFEFGAISKLLKLQPFKRLGELSYSIYMTHAAILFILISSGLILQKITGVNFTPLIDGQRYITTGNILLNNILILLILGIIIYLSTFTHKYIEKTGQRLGKNLPSKLSILRNSNA